MRRFFSIKQYILHVNPQIQYRMHVGVYKCTAYWRTPQAFFFCCICSKIQQLIYDQPAMSFSLSSSPSLFPLSLPPDKQWEAALGRNDEAQTQTSKEEEEEGPQRASEARVGLCALLQRHPGSHQGPKPQRHLRGRLQDCGLHVGQPRRGAEAGTSGEHVKQKDRSSQEEMERKLLLNEGENVFVQIFTNRTVCKSLHIHPCSICLSHRGRSTNAPTWTDFWLKYTRPYSTSTVTFCSHQ